MHRDPVSKLQVHEAFQFLFHTIEFAEQMPTIADRYDLAERSIKQLRYLWGVGPRSVTQSSKHHMRSGDDRLLSCKIGHN